ncbi:MAG: ATP-binding protein [Bacteroidales bacterium]|nr:ATP-binding protein [Bacteroidales bacterium]
MQFLDREKESARLKRAFEREKPQLIVVYGRRRIGKSTLIKHLLTPDNGDVYFLADKTSEPSQRQLFVSAVSGVMPGFDKVNYPDWESLFGSIARSLKGRIKICLDEFSYMVKSCPSLPSVIQKLIDNQILNFDLILCGSSQQMMQGFVLDSHEPLYGRADEILHLKPLPAPYIADKLCCDEEQAVSEYAVWGGISRYWELRNNYETFYEAIENLLFSADGTLYDESNRLLIDEMRDTVQASSILFFIGNGANKLSEIAA